MTRVHARTPDEVRAALPRIVEHLQADGIIAYPTETVYGFGGLVTDGAVARLRELKKREGAKPFLVLIDPDQPPGGVVLHEAAQQLARLFWPGPLTLAVPAEQGRFPDGISAPDGRVALRSSPHPFVRALTAAVGPITSTSANAPRSAPARDADGAEHALKDLGGRNVLIVDGGPLPESAPSTILAVDADAVRMLREGAITRDMLTAALAGTGIDVD